MLRDVVAMCITLYVTVPLETLGYIGLEGDT